MKLVHLWGLPGAGLWGMRAFDGQRWYSAHLVVSPHIWPLWDLHCLTPGGGTRGNGWYFQYGWREGDRELTVWDL